MQKKIALKKWLFRTGRFFSQLLSVADLLTRLIGLNVLALTAPQSL